MILLDLLFYALLAATGLAALAGWVLFARWLAVARYKHPQVGVEMFSAAALATFVTCWLWGMA